MERTGQRRCSTRHRAQRVIDGEECQETLVAAAREETLRFPFRDKAALHCTRTALRTRSPDGGTARLASTSNLSPLLCTPWLPVASDYWQRNVEQQRAHRCAGMRRNTCTTGGNA